MSDPTEGVVTESPQQNSRIYWEMFGGVNPEGEERYIHDLDMTLEIGGAAADVGGGSRWYQVSLYGRANVDSPNLVTFYRRIIDREPGQEWRHVRITEHNENTDVRCWVLKVECTAATYTTPDLSGWTWHYNDQYGIADCPPWGVRLVEYHVYGSPLGPGVTAKDALGLILSESSFSASVTVEGMNEKLDQLDFSTLPKDRWEALDEVNSLLGADYACWDGATVEFTNPGSGAAHTLSVHDPATTWDVQQSADETYSAVRVCYTNANGKPREEVVRGSSALPVERADTITAPDSVRSAKAARKVGKRYLRDHHDLQVEGSVGVTGNIGHADAMCYRPGDTVTMTGSARGIAGKQLVTHVTLRPLEWAADLSFGMNPKRFDIWLSRLAAGARSIKRR